eukprot:Blabericola_migrator_1__4483@NODE_2394_length_2833_cov_8_101952_g1499_i0_p1_GENE_NODE_2394_length_2833_cov_8_101952_g1499_i0NODE_2394_length_2833_cov_8_101952_g1499_i0_p1_ORF_typecomplete_len519_score46_78Diphthami_syn_2/PF01902_17/3_4e56ThiI/PF02568_14/0_22_NODE_2394_length_2833_cov_8_101952_g1499_i04281984
MKLLALISGGKDSILSFHFASVFGHEVVAAAHLEPKDGADETDSYMYQSVGSNLAKYVGTHLLGVPFFCRRIEGTPVEIQSNEYYGQEAADEVEDLYLLLKESHQHCKFDGVISGAIFSTYQKRRIENICDRLGLISFAPLWRWPQNFLLDHLTQFWTQDAFDVRLIKVATLGLNKGHLLRSMHEMRDVLISLYNKYKINVCGEGGEYETVTLKCPAYSRDLILESPILLGDPDYHSDGVWYVKANPALGEPRTGEHSKLGELSALFSSLKFYQDDCGLKVADYVDLLSETVVLKVEHSEKGRHLAGILHQGKILSAKEVEDLTCSRLQSTTPDFIGVDRSSSASLYAAYHPHTAEIAQVWKATRQGVLIMSDSAGYVPHLDPGTYAVYAGNSAATGLMQLLLCWRAVRNEFHSFNLDKARITRIEAEVCVNGGLSSEIVHAFSRAFWKANVDWVPSSRLALHRWAPLVYGSAGCLETLGIPDDRHVSEASVHLELTVLNSSDYITSLQGLLIFFEDA